MHSRPQTEPPVDGLIVPHLSLHRLLSPALSATQQRTGAVCHPTAGSNLSLRGRASRALTAAAISMARLNLTDLTLVSEPAALDVLLVRQSWDDSLQDCSLGAAAHHELAAEVCPNCLKCQFNSAGSSSSKQSCLIPACLCCLIG